MNRVYSVVQTSGFKKELARAKKRGLSSEDFDEVVVMLKNDEPLPPKYKDHKLGGKFKGYRECHINPDWLLVYQKTARKPLALAMGMNGTTGYTANIWTSLSSKNIW